MPRKSDTLARQWALLLHIPASPGWRSTRELHQYLLDQNFAVDLRTVQRDLSQLSNSFPLVTEERGKALHWQWMQGATGLEIPGMSRATAMVLQQADRYLRTVLPNSVVRLLSPYFARAEVVLDQSNLKSWRDRVFVVEGGPGLQPPEIDPAVRDVVYEAVLDSQQFECDYTARHQDEPKHLEVHPMGLVVWQGVTYLVATLWDYQDVRQLALHRMQNAQLLHRTARRPKGFRLEQYVGEDEAFNYPESARKIRLKARFDEGAAYHLSERRLADDQKLTQKEDGWFELTATVADTSALRWWLLGFGDGVEVLGPKALRDAIGKTALNMAGMYR